MEFRGGATSLFDVQSVRRSSFKTLPYGKKITCERLQKLSAYDVNLPWPEAAGETIYLDGTLS